MAKTHQTSGKKEKEKNRLNSRKDKEQRKEERKTNNNKGKGFEHMLAYVDEFGRITSTAPDPAKKKIIQAADIQIGVPKQEVAEPADVTRHGTVAFFNESKGYGFIKDHDTQESIFVHISALTNPVKENDKVTFEIEMGPRGRNAVNVKNA